MSKKLTAALLIVAAVLTNAAFTVLGTVFNYPDILGSTTQTFSANRSKTFWPPSEPTKRRSSDGSR